MTSRARRVVPAALLAFGLPLAGCGGSAGSSDKAADPRPSSQPSQGGIRLAALWPLTGRPAPHGSPKHPVLAVKIPNTPEAQPQVGLRQADLVTEQLVEGGYTRLAALYYSKLPPVVGPVRSMRASDLGIVQPTHGVLISSGGAPPTVRLIQKNKIRSYSEGALGGWFRVPDRVAPYNLFLHLRELAKRVPGKSVVPASYLPWGSSAKGKVKAKSVQVTFSPSRTTLWRYRDGHYVNTNSYASPKQQFPATTVLVLRVKEGDAGYLDPAGNKVPETIYHGKGKALLFHGGRMTKATWVKPKAKSLLRLRTSKGTLKVPAGRVWIELLPGDDQGGHVSWGK